jgi:uncharacterized membrane protein YoaK (UPF0700 family)
VKEPTKHEGERLPLAVSLIALAGYTDAVGFLNIGHFVSFMSGDSTQLAIATIGTDRHKAVLLAVAVVLFVAGSALGRVIFLWAGARRRPLLLTLVAALLALAATLGSSEREWLLIVPMVTAMGAQNSVVYGGDRRRTGVTYITGTLVRLGERIVDALAIAAPEERCVWLSHLVLWTGMLSGACAGTALNAVWGVEALFVAAFWSAGLAIITALTLLRSNNARPT